MSSSLQRRERIVHGHSNSSSREPHEITLDCLGEDAPGRSPARRANKTLLVLVSIKIVGFHVDVEFRRRPALLALEWMSFFPIRQGGSVSGRPNDRPIVHLTCSGMCLVKGARDWKRIGRASARSGTPHPAIYDEMFYNWPSFNAPVLPGHRNGKGYACRGDRAAVFTFFCETPTRTGKPKRHAASALACLTRPARFPVKKLSNVSSFAKQAEWQIDILNLPERVVERHSTGHRSNSFPRRREPPIN